MQISKFLFSALVAFTFGGVAHAAAIPEDADAVGIEMNLQVDGKTVATPYTLVLLGETDTVTQKNADGSSYVIQVTPTKTDKGFVDMAFQISKEMHGQTTLLSTPHVVTANAEQADIEVGKKGQPTVKLSVTPTL